MGTGIWIHIEYRKRKTKKYKYAGEFQGDRLYGVFGIICGIRSHIKPLYLPRGLPGGVNECIYKQYKEGKPDFHTPSWLSTNELRECLDTVNAIIKREDEQEGETYDPNWANSYEQLYDYMNSFDNVGEPARMVFWFDN